MKVLLPLKENKKYQMNSKMLEFMKKCMVSGHNIFLCIFEQSLGPKWKNDPGCRTKPLFHIPLDRVVEESPTKNQGYNRSLTY